MKKPSENLYEIIQRSSLRAGELRGTLSFVSSELKVISKNKHIDSYIKERLEYLSKIIEERLDDED